MNISISLYAKKMSLGIMALLGIFCTSYAAEYIQHFSSNITINANASMTVIETLEVVSAGQQIRRGIVREFPTRYNDYGGTYYHVDFEVRNITLDDQVVPYTVKEEPQGKRIYIGDPHKQLKPGVHKYTITYTTNRQLGFFKNHDELFWNVTGNGVRFPIHHVDATVYIPEGVAEDMVTVYGYTGYQNSQAQDYIVTRTKKSIHFSTTRELRPYEGLSVVVGWPKGFVQEPAWYTHVWWFFKDNGVVLWLVFWLLVCIGYYIYVWHGAWVARRPGTIIPLFNPPQDCTSSSSGYMTFREFSNKLVAAELVDLAVRGYITIAYDKDIYSLTSVYNPSKEMKTLTAWKDAGEPSISLLKILFSSDSVVYVTPTEHERFSTITSRVRMYCSQHFGKYLVSAPTGPGWIISFTAVVGALLVNPDAMYATIVWFIIVLYMISNVVATLYLTSYTQRGRLLQDQIDGFALFLQTTEIDRMKVVGTPPTKTPELYERYLPYAIALGIEQAWSRQFAPIFEQLKKAGTPYVPLWYHTNLNNMGGLYSLPLLSSQLSTAISSASTPPGRHSGFGSGTSTGGGSGRGGGGGGVGGW